MQRGERPPEGGNGVVVRFARDLRLSAKRFIAHVHWALSLLFTSPGLMGPEDSGRGVQRADSDRGAGLDRVAWLDG